MKETKQTPSSLSVKVNHSVSQPQKNVDANINGVTETFNITPVSLCASEKFSIESIGPTVFNNEEHDATSLESIGSKNLRTSFSISDKLRSWIVAHNISRRAANSMLCIMKSEGLCVPTDVRTLMKTPKIHNIQNISDGSYVHLGVENMLIPILTKYNLIIPGNVLEIGLNIDGVPLSKSSKSQCWPILLSILNVKEISNYVVPIGIFHGHQKPKCVEEFLNPFIVDILGVMSRGLFVKETNLKLVIKSIVCDAPAKSFLLNVKSHNAYFGCNSCIVEGTYLENRVAYLDIDSPLRTDHSFREKLDEDYHKGNSPLTLLPISITDTVCLDYMHNICLGIVKRLLEFWVKGKKNIRLTDVNKEKINEELKAMRSYVPVEFCRLPRSLDDLYFWKATELRNFLVYYGCIVLKGKLKKSLYSHFLLLVYATRILLRQQTCQLYNDTALKLLRKFVINYGMLYGQHFVTYNVHSVIHLPMFVKIHGPLDNFSCFKYENYLQELKKSVKCAQYPLQEIVNRVKEKQNIVGSNEYPVEINYCNEVSSNISSSYANLSDQFFKKVVLNYSKLTIDISKIKDSCLMLNNTDIVLVEEIVRPLNGPALLIVKKFLECTQVSNEPLSSTIVGLFIVNTENKTSSFSVKMDSILCKCVFVRISDVSAFLSTLCHKE